MWVAMWHHVTFQELERRTYALVASPSLDPGTFAFHRLPFRLWSFERSPKPLEKLAAGAPPVLVTLP